MDDLRPFRGGHLVDINRASYRRCAGWSKQAKRRCKRSATPGKNVCKIHGGYTPVGPKHGRFRKGHTSRFALPEELQAKLERYSTDPQLHDLNENIGLLYINLEEIMRGLVTGESPRLWEELSDAFAQFRNEQREGNLQNAQVQLDRIARVIALGDSKKAIWEEALRILEQIRKHTETDAKIKRDMHAYVTVEQAMLVIDLQYAVFMRALEEHVSGPEFELVVSTIEKARDRFLNRPPGKPALPGFVLEPGSRSKRAKSQSGSSD